MFAVAFGLAATLSSGAAAQVLSIGEDGGVTTYSAPAVYTDAEVTKDTTYQGMRLQNVAKNSGSLSAVYDFGSIVGGDKLRVGAGARYVGERAGDALNDFDLPGYTVADAFATYDTKVEGQKVNFHVNVKNLFDRTYYTSAASRTFVSIGDARQLTFSSTLEF